MQKVSENSNPPVIGRSKTVLIDESSDNPIGIVTEVVVRPSSDEKEGRLVFRGPAYFKERSKHHLDAVVLPLVDRITESLGLPKGSYEASIVNIGAAASSGLGLELTGFSADLPVFLALLSSSVHVSLRQDIVCTGHIASLDGDMASVRGIPAKLDAALSSPGITGLVFPELEKDTSLQLLTPLEYQAAKESMLARKGDIKIYPIKDVYDAVKIFMMDESILNGSLISGFFHNVTLGSSPDNPIGKTSLLLSDGNERRFWDVLERSLLNRHVEKAKLLMRAYANSFIQSHCYPENFGKNLFYLVVSLPPLIREIDDLFPLISTDLCIKLTQHAASTDHDDVRKLYKAAFGEGLGDFPRPGDKSTESKAHGDEKDKGLFERLLSEISDENLAEKVGLPLDRARAAYVTNSVTVKDGREFNKAITAFYTHLFRHTGSHAGNINQAALSAEAIATAQKAFESKGGFKAALAEGVHGINGGMRMVFDTMTEYLKQEEKEKYVTRVFKVAIDPLGWDEKVSLMEVFIERIGPQLPADLRDLPAKQLASHWDEIIRCYAESMDNVSDLMKRL